MDFSYLWKGLKFRAANAAFFAVSGHRLRFQEGKSELEFKNPRYKSVIVHTAKQLAMSEIEGQLHKILPKYKKNAEDKSRKYVLEQRDENRVQLIKNQEKQSESWGKITAEGGHVIVAKNRHGDFIKEAMMVYYDAEEQHNVTDVEWTSEGDRLVPRQVSFQTKTLCHIDLSPRVSMNSSKNIVMTQVQGRSKTRKELVSGGDFQFSVSGEIVSEEMGVYPTEAVKKFIQMMEYEGVLNVNYMMFEPFNVTRIIIKDYSLGTPEYKNKQPYTFNCVAVEPDEDVQIINDTISLFNQELQLSPMNEWHSFILDTKKSKQGLPWEQMLFESTAQNASNAVLSVTGFGLDALVPNI